MKSIEVLCFPYQNRPDIHHGPGHQTRNSKQVYLYFCFRLLEECVTIRLVFCMCLDLWPHLRIDTAIVWKSGYIITFKEENIEIYRRYIGDISCIGRGRHDISWRKIKSRYFRKYRQNIGDIQAIYRRYIADFLVIFPLLHAT